jgi:MOSC domain-containing protein YiiM
MVTLFPIDDCRMRELVAEVLFDAEVMMSEARHLTTVELEAGLDTIRQSPRDEGVLELIVRRPQTDAREVLEEGELDPAQGLVGDNWGPRGSADGAPAVLDRQLTLMNARVIALLAQTKERWPLAGDQLFVDLDLSAANVPPGTRLAIGSAVVAVTAPPHTGCRKFTARFGADAMAFVNSPTWKHLQLRGVHARVMKPGFIHVGDVVRKL